MKPKSKYEIAQAGYKEEKAEKERLRKVGLDTAMQVSQGVSAQCKVLKLLYYCMFIRDLLFMDQNPFGGRTIRYSIR